MEDSNAGFTSNVKKSQTSHTHTHPTINALQCGGKIYAIQHLKQSTMSVGFKNLKTYNQ